VHDRENRDRLDRDAGRGSDGSIRLVVVTRASSQFSCLTSWEIESSARACGYSRLLISVSLKLRGDGRCLTQASTLAGMIPFFEEGNTVLGLELFYSTIYGAFVTVLLTYRYTSRVEPNVPY